MPKYIKRNGFPTRSNDPLRMIWCSPCGFWTDDFDKVSSQKCPACGSTGFVVTADSFNKGALVSEKREPGFAGFLKDNKENCMAQQGGMLAAWKAKQNAPNI